MLSREERERAARIRRGRDRWIVGRALLRLVLGGCLGREPRSIEFRLGPNAKPELAPDEGEPPPHFNLSHSGRLVLIAVADAPVGVDVERIRELDLAGMARQVFRPDEAAALNGIPAARRTEAFIAAWTRKEAYLKARGLGIGGMRGVAVDVNPDEPARLLGADDSDIRRWTLVDLAVEPGYRAALAVLGRPNVFRRSWDRTDTSPRG